jgi:hypothetical protein
MTEFQENKPEVTLDTLNQCFHCGIRPGKYFNKLTQKNVGIFLYADARGFRCCNLCKEKGLYIGKRRMGKKEKKEWQILRREFTKVKDIKHITLDAKGNEVT